MRGFVAVVGATALAMLTVPTAAFSDTSNTHVVTIYTNQFGIVRTTDYQAPVTQSPVTRVLTVPGPVAGAGLVPLLGLAGAWYARRRRRSAA